MVSKAQLPAPRFTRKLRHWHLKFNDREMPWKGEKDPYRIWLSEIILQQTRVEQGLKYYEAFVREFPDIHKLAAAREEKVFKLWEGLGYYSRCRNLIHTAREISKESNGVFPDRYESIRELKGVGPYTAAAISSFAFQLPFAVVDGNVIRVLSRIFGVEANAGTTKGRRIFDLMAADLLDKKDPAAHNQAIMDFGATICKPVAPLCASCDFRKDCFAFTNDRVDSLPVKLIKPQVRTRWFYFMVLRKNGKLAVRKRSSGDIWEGLYEFPSVESAKKLSQPRVREMLGSRGYFPVKPSVILSQQLTHQKIEARFFLLEIDEHSKVPASFSFKTKRELDKLAFPKMLREYLKMTDLFG
jgi:A/G-specific adenine glycosylase